jgi:hypothetical protein
LVELSLLVKRWFHLQIFHAAAPIRRKHIRTGKGDMLVTFLIVLMLAFGIAACIVAVSLSLLMATVALTVAAIRQSVRVTVKALDASITWIETRTDRALLRLRA